MFRNLLSTLPSITRTELHQRAFRSLSPAVKFSHNKTKTLSETCLSSKSVNDLNDYNKNHFSTSNDKKEDDATIKEIKWREEPQKLKLRKRKDKKIKELKVEENTEVIEEEPSPPQIQYCEQFELEAARPRPVKSREILEKLKRKPTPSMFGTQLQPNKLQPYGSQDNSYSYNLLASASARLMQKKFRNKEIKEKSHLIQSTSKKSYSTSIQAKDINEKELDLGSKKSDASSNINTKFLDYSQRPKSWNCGKSFDISPPKFKTLEDDADFIKVSTQKAYRQTREEANKNTHAHYKKSFTDFVKLRNEQAFKLKSLSNIQCVDCKAKKKTDSIFNNESKLSISALNTNKRNMSTFSYKKPKKNMSEMKQKQLRSKFEKEQQVKISKSISKDRILLEKEQCEEKNNQITIRTPPMEPKDLDCQQPPKSNKVFLSSKVRLPVVKCLPKFVYPCPIPEPCPPRADQCLKVVPKRLPTMFPKECPCVERTFTDVPKLKRLRLEFKDPPKESCYQEPCQIPRADDKNPYKFKPLKPLVMGECKCVEPPPMTDVKLKRLPPCEPEDVCRPVREPCVKDACPPRADDGIKVLKKKLPVLEAKPCPCTEPPKMSSPSLARLNLKVPEPKRICVAPSVCDCKDRADKCYVPKRKVLPKFVPGDCPCIDQPMTDVKFKRLECIDEPRECIVTVPDHCVPYPRADYGCWEFEQNACYEVPKECVQEPPEDPCIKYVPKDPCERRDSCKTSGPLNYSKRKYNTDSTSTIIFDKKSLEKNATIKTLDNQKDNVVRRHKKSKRKLDKRLKSNISLPTVQLLKELDKAIIKSDKTKLTFDEKTEKSLKKIDYESILKKIEDCSGLRKKKNTSVVSLSQLFSISSKAMSTSQKSHTDELQIRKQKELECKKKCYLLKPKTICHVRRITKGLLCGHNKCKEQTNNMCQKKMPVCCEKEEAPYEAFSDKIYDIKVDAFKGRIQRCPKSKCVSTSNPIPHCEKRNFFSTSSLIELPVDLCKLRNSNQPIPSAPNFISTYAHIGNRIVPSTAITLLTSQSRSLATKVFKIQEPKTNPDELESSNQAYKIMCLNYDEPCHTMKKSCRRIFYEKIDSKVKTPYPAFSDCLDEDMEDILSECPLERDRYTRLQPRNIPSPKSIKTPPPPPPDSEPLDLFKEQYCILTKLGKLKGVTQDCKNFNHKIKLLKSRKIFKECNKDCLQSSLNQKRQRYSTVTKCFSDRNYLYETTNHLQNSNLGKVERFHNRNFYSLTNPFKPILVDTNIKELTLNQAPDALKPFKCLKVKNIYWKQKNFKFKTINEGMNIPIKIKRFYNTSKGKHNFIKTGRNVSSNVLDCQKRDSDPNLKFIKLLKHKKLGKTSSQKNNGKNTKCPKFPSSKCSSFTTQCTRKIVITKDCSKPNTPYPSFSECEEHDVSRPVCECSLDAQILDDLQPKCNVLSEVKENRLPTHEIFDKTLGMEYSRQKMGVQKKGFSLDCKSFPEYMGQKKFRKESKFKRKIHKSHNMESQGSEPTKEKTYEIECIILDEKEPCDPCRDLQACCSQMLEQSECEEDEIKEALSLAEPVIPPTCDLPEEERVFRENCIVSSVNFAIEENVCDEVAQKLNYEERSKEEDESSTNVSKCKIHLEDKNICKGSEAVKDFCEQITYAKSEEVPEKVKGISEECAKKLVRDCDEIAQLAEKCLKKYSEKRTDTNKKRTKGSKCTTKENCLKNNSKHESQVSKLKYKCTESQLKSKVSLKPECKEPQLLKPKCAKPNVNGKHESEVCKLKCKCTEFQSKSEVSLKPECKEPQLLKPKCAKVNGKHESEVCKLKCKCTESQPETEVSLKPECEEPELLKPKCAKPKVNGKPESEVFKLKCKCTESQSKSEVSLKPECEEPELLKPKCVKPMIKGKHESEVCTLKCKCTESQSKSEVSLKPECEEPELPKPKCGKPKVNGKHESTVCTVTCKCTESQSKSEVSLKPECEEPELPKPKCGKPKVNGKHESTVCTLTCKCTESQSKSEVSLKPECEEPELLKPKCVKPKVECEHEKKPNLSLWQRVVNYFKARPGCPEPGDWKKQALNNKAHKAAAAAGLIAIDPKCVPRDILEKAKSDPCCRVCPSDYQLICKPSETNMDTSSYKKLGVSAGKTAKFGIFKRNYSKSFSWTNLDEINKILEEDRQQKHLKRTSRCLHKDFAFFYNNEPHAEQIQRSLQYQLKEFPIRVSMVCKNVSNYPQSYFGYTDILPSRENILERTWRNSMEALKRNCEEEQALSFLIEMFKKVDNDIKTQEDTEKLKTEDVLRELEQFIEPEEENNKD